MTPEEKLQEAAKKVVTKNSDKIKEFEYLVGETGSGSELANLIFRMFLTGAKSDESAAYHKEKNKWYTEENVKLLCAKLLDDFTNPEYLKLVVKDFPNWFEQNKKK